MSIQASNVNYNNNNNNGSNMMINFGGSGRPSSSTTTSNASGGNAVNNAAIMMQNGGMFIQIPSTNMTSVNAPSTSIGVMHSGRQRLDVNSDKRLVVQAMLLPNSGLEIRNRTWLKMLIPMSFLGYFIKK